MPDTAPTSLTDLLIRKSWLEGELSWQRRVAKCGASYVDREKAEGEVSLLEVDLSATTLAISNIIAVRKARLGRLLRGSMAVLALVWLVGVMAWRSGLLKFG